MLTIILFLLLLSILILIHELGHFIAARKLGVIAEEFGLGLPPKVKRLFTWRGTEFTLNWLPIGGFVRMRGEEQREARSVPPARFAARRAGEAGKREELQEGFFYAQKAWKRAVIILAGVFMNFVLAVVLFTAVYQVLGIPTKTEDVVIEAIAPDSPAEQVGLEAGDIVRTFRIADRELRIADTTQFVNLINDHRGKEVTLTIEREREGKQLEMIVAPRLASDTPEGEGALGVAISNVKFLRYPWWQMPVRSAITGTKEAFGWGVTILSSLRDMVKSLVLYGQVPKDVAGPIGIARLTGHVAQQGWLAFLQFAGVLSINLAILNALPIPALDGGRLAFLGIEVLRRGKPIDPKTEHRIHLVGYAVLIALIVLVSVRDVVAPAL